jgi:hypothetical protein
VLLRGVPVADQRTEPIEVSRRDGNGDANSQSPGSPALVVSESLIGFNGQI